MDQSIKIVLQYLKDKDCIESFLTLERQSGVHLVNYSKEIQFFKKIILKGDFNEAVIFLSTFENRVEENLFKKIVLDVYKQKLCELIQNPNEEELKDLFQRQLISYCREEQFQELFNYLTYRSVNQIQGLEKWTVLRGRYQCFENIIPSLEMFNSVLKNQQVQQKLQDILAFYNQNKDYLKQPYSFNRKGSNREVVTDTLQKNKSSIPMNSYKPSHQYTSSEQSQKKTPFNQNTYREKDLIKSSVANMNISGNYSQIKSKLMARALDDPKKSKYNASYLPQNQSKVEHLPAEQRTKQVIDKSQAFNEKAPLQADLSQQLADKNNSSLRQSTSKNTFAEQKRPRANANLSGPMNRDRLQGSVKVDNFMRNESQTVNQDNTPSSYKNIKLEKSQMMNLSGNYSHLSKSGKTQKMGYSNKIENALSYGHFNQLQSSHLNEIQEEDHSEATKSIKNQPNKYSYLTSKREDDDLEDQVRRNIEYLQQTSSVIYNKDEIENDGYTFSNQKEENRDYKVSKIIKLASTTDSKAIRTCQFSDSGNLFAVGTNSSILKVFDVQGLFNKNKYQEIVPIYQIDNLHIKSIFCLHWHSNQRSLVTCSNDLNIKLTEISKNWSDHKSSIIGKHQSCIRMVKFSPSEGKVFSCGDDSTIKAWDLGKIKKCVNLKGHTNSVSAIKLQNQNQLYSVSKDQTIKKWDLRINENVATSQFQESELTYIANNTDDIIVSHKNGTVSFFSHSLQLIHSVQIHEEQIRSIEALKNDNTLLTASFDGHVAFFNEHNSHQPSYFQHNDGGDDKVVFATFLHSANYRGFSSTSTQGLCHIYSYQ